MVEALLETISKHMKDKKLISSSHHGFMFNQNDNLLF